MSKQGIADQQRWFRENGARFSGTLGFDEPLSRHTYYRIGGPAAVFAVPKSREDLLWLAQGVAETGIPVFVLGSGSNLLVSDLGFSGLVVRATRVNPEIVLVNSSGAEPFPLRIRTGGSVSVSSLLRAAVQNGWGGLEFLCGIPGMIGGTIVMNAGTRLGETRDRVLRVETLSLISGADPTLRVFEGAALRFEYRKNLFLPPGSIVWSAEWAASPRPPEEVRKIVDESLLRRKTTQPINFPSCGSVFKNPRQSGMSAWQIINELGLRGHRVGNAQFSVKHSNFIVNLGGATASDVKALIDLARERALTQLGVHLETEVHFVGEGLG